MKNEEDPRLAVLRGRSIALVGLMGAGKTTIGRRLAHRLDTAFHDADEEIEAAAGMSVSDIFDLHGEAAFRDVEKKVIARLLDGPAAVIATGGGAFLAPDTRALIKQRALSVWLQADIAVLVRRATRRNTRPLLRDGDPKEILSALLKERTPCYAEADVTVVSGEGSHNQTVAAVVEALNAYAGTPS